jgi:uncharacterized protein
MMLLFLLMSLAAGPAPAPGRAPAAAPVIDPAKEADIRKLMAITGQGELGPSVVEQVMASFKAAYTKVPDATWTELEKQMDPASLTTMLVPQYDSRFSADEVKQLLTFYQSPLGKKLVKTLPELNAASEDVAADWAHKAADRMTAQLEAKGYKLPTKAR